LNSLGTKRSTGETKRKQNSPPDASSRTSCQRKREERRKKPTTNNTKLHSLEDSENKTPQPYNWEKTTIPMVHTMEETKLHQGREAEKPPFLAINKLLGCFSEKTHTRNGSHMGGNVHPVIS
jgi:hypothetical protein